jgi:uncharacterized NAD(P)/FAD-binding protein YdhS
MKPYESASSMIWMAACAIFDPYWRSESPNRSYVRPLAISYKLHHAASPNALELSEEEQGTVGEVLPIVSHEVDALPAVEEPRPELPIEPAGGNGCRIAVIGAGFSGVLVALHLLWRCRRNDRVYLVERAPRFGLGLAYSTGNPRHLLNVRIDHMSAFADEPDHFARWFTALPEDERLAMADRSPAGTFVHRQLYGAYIQSLLEDSITRLGGGRNLYLITDEATGLRPVDSGLVLETAGGRPYATDAAVLALGNFPPDRSHAPGYFGNPWQPEATRGLEPGRPVLLIGTGLTMIDVCLALLEDGFAGPIYALSRRGLLPQEHAPAPRWDGLVLGSEDRRSLASLCRAVRREVRRATEQRFDWRSVMDALRPHTELLWQELAPADKQRFLRHLRPWWEIHRHRLAPSVAAEIRAIRARGALQVLTGQLDAIEPGPHGLTVSWRPRGESALRQLVVQRVINCSGPQTDPARLSDPLIVQLRGAGLARPDAYGLGMDATGQGALVDREGKPSSRLFGIGPIVRGAYWEITSVPDIRNQAERVALAVLDAARRAAVGTAAEA